MDADECEQDTLLTLSFMFVYVDVFGSDVERWMAFLQTEATPEQRTVDLPLVERFRSALQGDPNLQLRVLEALDALRDVRNMLRSDGHAGGEGPRQRAN